MSQSKIKDTLSYCLGIVLIGVLIQGAGVLKGDDLVFPGVAEILQAFFRLLATPKTYLLIRTTLQHLILSMVISTAVGVVLGMGMGLNRLLRQLLTPLMVFLRSFPMIILIFVIMVVVRREHYSAIPVLASALVLIPMIAEAACEGCVRIDRELIDVYRMNSLLNLRVLCQVYLPLTSGYLRQAYVNAVGMGVKLAVSTEYMVNIRSSLGSAVQASRDAIEYQDIYAYALVMILLVLLVTEAPMLIWRCVRRLHKQAS